MNEHSVSPLEECLDALEDAQTVLWSASQLIKHRAKDALDLHESETLLNVLERHRAVLEKHRHPKQVTL